MKKLHLLLIAICSITGMMAQSNVVGIGTNTPKTKLDVVGDLALREGTAIAVTGANPVVAVSLSTTASENSFYRITGAPTGTMTLNSIANGVDGQIITLVNATTIKLKITNTASSGGILTSGGAITYIAANGTLTLQYSATADRWFITNSSGATITDWIKATTTDEAAISTDNQYVTGNIGLGNFSASAPSAKLDVIGNGLFRNGNANTAFTNDQLLFGYNNTNTYMHSIKSRHNGGSATGNSLDFFLWKQGTDATTIVGTEHIMTLDGYNGGSVGIGTTGPTNQLEISGTTGSLELGANGWLDPGTSGAGICAENSTYKTLMIVGNNVSGNKGQNREVQVWDYMKVNGYLTVGTQANATATAPPSGTIRYNSTRKCMEYYDGTYWICMGPPTVQRVTVRDHNDENYTGSGCNSCSGWAGGYGQTFSFTINNLYAGQKIMFMAEVMFDNDTHKNSGFLNATKIYGNGYWQEVEVSVPGNWETVQTKVFPAQQITSTGNLTFTFESNTGMTDVRITAIAY